MMSPMIPDRRSRARASTDVVRDLAAQADCTIEEARAAYERELAELDARARVKMYVPVLAKRFARERLKRH